MKKIIYLLFGLSTLIISSCGKGDFVAPQQNCVTTLVPQQITLDWAYYAPSYYEVNSTNNNIPCTQDPFYDQSTGELSQPPFASSYNYLTQASAIPSAALLPSSPFDKTNTQKNELGIPQSSSNYFCQITIQSEESGSDNCLYNGQSGAGGPNSSTVWSTAGAIESVKMYEFTNTSVAGIQTNLNNQIIIDYFDVYSLCSTVNERPYFTGVVELPVPVAAAANSTPTALVYMSSSTPVTQ